MSTWVSGDSLTPSTLNRKLGSAATSGGYSTNTLGAESGNTIAVTNDFLQIFTLDSRQGSIFLRGSSGTTSGVQLFDNAGDPSSRILTVNPVAPGDGMTLIVAPGSARTDASLRNTQLLIYGIPGANYERFGVTYYAGAFVVDSTVAGSGTLRPIDYASGSTSVARMYLTPSGLGSLGVYGVLSVNSGSATEPTLSFRSETSLGFYRSAASSVALSYGTLQVSGLSTNALRADGAVQLGFGPADNVYLFGGSGVTTTTAQGVMAIHNCGLAPTAPPSSGGVLFVRNGALLWLGGSNSLTTIAVA